MTNCLSDKFRLNPNLRLVEYAGQYFTYDTRASRSPLIELPTKEISEKEYLALERLKTRGFFIEPRTKSETLAYFAEEGLTSAIFETFLQQNFLKKYISSENSIKRKVVNHFDNLYRKDDAIGDLQPAPPFDESDDNLHVFSLNTFFNLPININPTDCHIGLLGFPHASLDISVGTEAAPNLLRLHSRSISWFDVFKQGVYTEITTEDYRPSLLCKGTIVRDAGNLSFQGATLMEMLASVKSVFAQDFFACQVYPIILGGDHAITYPIVMAYLEEIPNLGLLHLDAHNDLFYTPDIIYNHAAPLSNLLRRTSIEQIVSFGLRTTADRRVGIVNSIYKKANASKRIQLHSLIALKQMIMNPMHLEATLGNLSGRPYYLTIDLDVLSESAIGGRVSTPLGHGLEWHELFYFISAAFQNLNIIGCDIVEYNALNGERTESHQLNSLILLLIDRLSKNNPKHQDASNQASEKLATDRSIQ